MKKVSTVSGNGTREVVEITPTNASDYLDIHKKHLIPSMNSTHVKIDAFSGQIWQSSAHIVTIWLHDENTTFE